MATIQRYVKSRPYAGFQIIYGGAERDRTADLLNAIQALSQLSYSPTSKGLSYYQTVVELSTFFYAFLLDVYRSIEYSLRTVPVW